jgi:Lactate racemase N-terminal domain
MPYYPRVFRVRQSFENTQVTDVAATTFQELAKLKLSERVKAGQSVAITAGSRGITNIPLILRATVDYFKSIGAKPFITAAMGSHGGATAEGQLEVLHTLGINEESVGCPIRSSMETVTVCQTKEGFPVYFDKHAFGADHVVVVNRVKPHTDFSGEIESGLMKMMLIGLGKCDGAKIYHRAIMDYSFDQIVKSVADRVLAECRIVAGLAIVENGYDETALIEAVAPQQIVEREKGLLVLGKRLLPRLPFPRVDVLLVDQIGKNISGTGLDTNVVGRKFNDNEAAPEEWPKVRRIALRTLTEATHGNATGVGIGEFVTERLAAQIDWKKTYLNCVTSGRVAGAMLPLTYPTDQAMLDAALVCIGLVEPLDAKLLWIQDTLHLAEVECSETYLTEARSRPDLEILTEPRALPFLTDGNLPADGMRSLAGGKYPAGVAQPEYAG